MLRTTRWFLPFAFAATFAFASFTSGEAEAKRKTPYELPAGNAEVLPLAGPQLSVMRAAPQAEALAVPPSAAEIRLCCLDRDVKYKYHGKARRAAKSCCPAPTQEVVLLVKDPCRCCYVEVPVCLPCCCDGEPEVCGRARPILKGSVTTFEWCCGYRVKVVMNRCGDLAVNYYAK